MRIFKSCLFCVAILLCQQQLAGYYSLFEAVRYDDAQEVQRLLEAGAVVNEKGEYGTPVFFAVRSPKVGQILVNWIKAHGKDPVKYINTRDADGEIPLMKPCTKKVFEFLLDNGANIDAKTSNDRSIFHFLNFERAEILVTWLRVHGKDPAPYINARHYGNTALKETQEKKLIEFLLDNGATIDETIFHYINLEKAEVLVTWLKTHGKNKDLAKYLNAQDRDAIPLSKAQDEKLIEFLLDNGADIDIKDPDCPNIFHKDVRVGTLEVIVNWLKNHGKDPAHYINVRDSRGRTPLMKTRSYEKEVFEFLLKNGASIDKTIFHETDLRGEGTREILANWLRQQGNLADYINAPDKDGRTPLMKAQDKDATEFFLNNGANIDAKDSKDNTIFHHVDLKKAETLAKWLKAHNMGLAQYINAKNQLGRTSLFGAHPDAVEFLLDNGANIDAKDSEGNTIFHYLYLEKAEALDKWLKAHGKNISHYLNAINQSGKLHWQQHTRIP